MKKTLMTMMFLSVALLAAGCATSDKTKADNLEARVSTLETKVKAAGPDEAASTQETSVREVTAAAEVAAPETPSKEDIQAALKNAGYYDGLVDGKFGPMTQKAIQDFQSANELKVDGKVGPNTWDRLKKFYVAPDTSSSGTTAMTTK